MRGFHGLRLDVDQSEAVATFTQVEEVLLAFGLVFHLRMRIFVGILFVISAIIAAWLALTSVAPAGLRDSPFVKLSSDSAVYLTTGVYLSIVTATLVLAFANLAGQIVVVLDPS